MDPATRRLRAMDKADRKQRAKRRRERLKTRAPLRLTAKSMPDVPAWTVLVILIVGTLGLMAFFVYFVWWAYSEDLYTSGGTRMSLPEAIIVTILASAAFVGLVALWVEVVVRLGDEEPRPPSRLMAWLERMGQRIIERD